MKEFIHSSLLAALPPVILFCGIFFIIYLRGFFVFHPIKTAGLMFSGKSKLRELSVSLAGALGVGCDALHLLPGVVRFGIYNDGA